MKLKQDLSLRSLLVRSLVVTGVMVLLGCTQNISAQWTASPSPSPNNNIYYNAGAVGIGTTSPGALLHVAGTSLGDTFRLQYNNGSNGGNWAINPFIIGVSNGGLSFLDNQHSTIPLVISDAGNVGIGTTRPISGGGGASWLTINGSSYSGGVVYGVSGTAKGYTYYDNSVGAMSMQSASGVPLALTINGTSALFIDTSRNVGIGTTSPGGLLHVATTSASDTFRLQYNNGSNGGNWTINPFISGVSNGGLSFLDSQHSTVPLVISDAGNVGIGKTNPSEKLEVVGNINVSGSGAGNIYLSGTINAKYQDVAEWVPSSEQNPVGTVVVLDSTRSNQVISSTQAYDTRVAGVVSEKPGIALGESGANKVLVATTGRVLVKVDASNGPIHIGDLLVTSDIPGLAMKSEPITIGNRKMHMPGTLIGKALEPLEKGSGKILVLLSLQ